MESSKQDQFEESSRRRWRPTPSMFIAMLALFVALGGTASALSGKFSVKKGDIAPNAVQRYALGNQVVNSNKLADASVGTYKIHTGASKVESAEASTTSTVPADLGGPTTSMRSTGANTARVYLYEPTLIPTPQKVLGSGATTNFQTRYSTPGPGTSGADDGVTSAVRSGWITIPNSSGGTKNFSLRFDTTGGTSIFKDRRLTVNVVR